MKLGANLSSSSRSNATDHRPGRRYARVALGCVILILSSVFTLAFLGDTSPRSTEARWHDDTFSSGNFDAGTGTAPVINQCNVRGLLAGVRTEIVWHIPGETPSAERLAQTEIHVEGRGLLGGIVRLPLGDDDHETSIGTTRYTTTVTADVLSGLLVGAADIDFTNQSQGWTSTPASVHTNAGVGGLLGSCTIQ